MYHPYYTAMLQEWEKFRLTFEGGYRFRDTYLKKFSTREDDTDFSNRKAITHVPAHAKAAILDIRNAIFKRMIDITRVGGPSTYKTAIDGYSRGVDGRGNSMNSYIGQTLLPELLVMGRVGVYIDKNKLSPQPTLAETRSSSPYIYHYRTEDIISWHHDDNNRLDAVLLRDRDITIDEDTGLPNGYAESKRLLRLVGDQVALTLNYGEDEQTLLLDIPEIPFVILELDHSLMSDVADYQITLLNLASSDVNYALKSNFPFYTEQYAPEYELTHIRPAGTDGTSTEAEAAKERSLKTGVQQGRRYPRGVERPAFIHPSPEPLRASIELQEKLKRDIRQLVNLSLSNLAPQRASAESKQEDDKGLEGGLANIGLVLEAAERNIGRIWWWYESNDGGEVTVKYPDSYYLRTDDDRRKEASELREILPTIPSKTFQKQTAKDIVTIMMGHKVTRDDLKKMHEEIESSPVIVTDPDILKQDFEAGFVGVETASKMRGYPANEWKKAAKDHAERAARIVQAQTAQARGVDDLGNNPNAGRDERKTANDTTLDISTEDKTRGEADA